MRKREIRAAIKTIIEEELKGEVSRYKLLKIMDRVGNSVEEIVDNLPKDRKEPVYVDPFKKENSIYDPRPRKMKKDKPSIAISHTGDDMFKHRKD